MKIAFFSAMDFETSVFDVQNIHFKHEIQYFDNHLNNHTREMAKGFPTVCCFVNDTLSNDVIKFLAAHGTRLIALRSAGFNHVDLAATKKQGVTVVRVPEYSPYAVAEHAAGLILMLNRKLHRAYNRVRESDFSLHGLLGFDLHGKTVGVIGTGRIGAVFAKIMRGFGCNVLAYDIKQNPECIEHGINYVALDELIAASHIISLHCPLTPDTLHLINETRISQMQPGVMLVNTSRGAMIDTKAVINALKTGQIGYLGLDVYEEEGDLFFEDLSDKVIQDDCFARLQTFPNVVITGHQAFFTNEALTNIAKVTLQNITNFEQGSEEIFTI